MLAFKPRSQPFHFLLYTEWLMLASCGVMAAIEAWQEQHIPVQHILILAALGVMGWMMPSGKTSMRYLYTAIEMGLIFYGTTLGYLHILPTLYLIVLIRSCFLFEPPGRWIVAGLSLILFMVHQVQYMTTITALLLPDVEQQRIWMHQVAEVLMFGLGLFFVSQLVNTLLTERRTQEQLALAHEQLRQYALKVEDLAAVQERNRIAREIHDSLGHALTALNVQLQTAVKLWDRSSIDAKPFLEQAQKLGTLAMKEVRRSVNALRADADTEEPLEQAIATLVKDFCQGTGVAVSTQIDLQTVLPAQTAKTIYRVIQESLTNICKHAQATSAQIHLQQTTDKICLTIADNGKGFRLQSGSSGFGLHSMRERIAALDGTFEIEAQPGSGCSIHVELPLQRTLA